MIDPESKGKSRLKGAQRDVTGDRGRRLIDAESLWELGTRAFGGIAEATHC